MKLSHILLAGAIGCVAQNVAAENIVATDAYRWVGDSIIQGEFKAYAPDAQHLISNYSARPHFFMPIEKKWSLKNDISSYPQLTTPNMLHTAVYNMALDEMANAVEPDTTLRTGKGGRMDARRELFYHSINGIPPAGGFSHLSDEKGQQGGKNNTRHRLRWRMACQLRPYDMGCCRIRAL